MCKRDFHESTWNCAEPNRYFPYIPFGENPRNSPFSVVELYEGKIQNRRNFRDF